mgnify:FL=1
MDLTRLSITELKALKCDVYEAIQQTQLNLQVINEELRKRQEEETKNKDSEAKTKGDEKTV